MKTFFVSLLLVFVLLGERISFSQGHSVTVTSADVNNLADRLVAFRSSLSVNNARSFDQIICRAASVRSEGSNVRVSSRLFSEGIVVQGGRQGSAKGFSIQTGENAIAKAIGNNPYAVGPKHDDPYTPPGPSNKSFREELSTFGSSLNVQERSMMDWIFARASQASGAPKGVPGGYPPASKKGVRTAFGILEGDASPEQGNPKPPRNGPNSSWTVTFN